MSRLGMINPVPLAPGVCYNACTGFSGGFPDTNNQFGSGDPFSGGIVARFDAKSPPSMPPGYSGSFL